MTTSFFKQPDEIQILLVIVLESVSVTNIILLGLNFSFLKLENQKKYFSFLALILQNSVAYCKYSQKCVKAVKLKFSVRHEKMQVLVVIHIR